MKTILIGIDPGLSGAVSVFCNGELIDVESLQYQKPERNLNEVNGGAWFYKKELDTKYLYSYVKDHIKGALEVSAFIEDITVIKHGQSARKGLLTVGKNYGSILTCLDLVNIAITPVQPLKWKKALQVTSDKQTSIDKCVELLGRESCSKFGLLKDDNKSEAVLIAYYGSTLE